MRVVARSALASRGKEERATMNNLNFRAYEDFRSSIPRNVIRDHPTPNHLRTRGLPKRTENHSEIVNQRYDANTDRTKLAHNTLTKHPDMQHINIHKF